MPARDVRRRRTRRRNQYNRRRNAQPWPQDDEQQQQQQQPVLPLPLLRPRHLVVDWFIRVCMANISAVLKEINEKMPRVADDFNDWGKAWLEAMPLDDEGHMIYDYDPHAKRQFFELRNYFLLLLDDCAFVSNVVASMERAGPRRIPLEEVGVTWMLVRELSSDAKDFARRVDRLCARGVKDPKKSTVELEYVIAGLAFLGMLPFIVQGLSDLCILLFHLVFWFMSTGLHFLLLLYLLLMLGLIGKIWQEVRRDGLPNLGRLLRIPLDNSQG